MAKSEIDDVFASKGRATATQPTSSSAAPVEKRRKSKKKKSVVEIAKTTNEVTTKKRAAPETVVDPSSRLPSAKRVKASVATTTNILWKNDNAKGDGERFKDSRGSGPRRKTEEGFLIFKEDELGIKNEGGGETRLVQISVLLSFFTDTPLCPFDCQCCF